MAKASISAAAKKKLTPQRAQKFWSTFDRWQAGADRRLRAQINATPAVQNDLATEKGLLGLYRNLSNVRDWSKKLDEAIRARVNSPVGQTGVQIEMRPGIAPSYHPVTKQILSTPSRATSLHEAGHAVDLLSKPGSSVLSPTGKNWENKPRLLLEAKANLFGSRMARELGVPNYQATMRPSYETYRLGSLLLARLQSKGLVGQKLPGLIGRAQKTMPKTAEASESADSKLIAAGLLVQARDTGRVLMLQRAYDNSDPAGGTWEAPGGHIEEGETPFEAAKREWAEETGFELPKGSLQGVWNYGIYRGHVWSIAKESMLDISVPHGEGNRKVFNPDNPDNDYFEAMAWWDPKLLLRNPSIRQELRASMHLVQKALDREKYLEKEYARRLKMLEERRSPKHAAVPSYLGKKVQETAKRSFRRSMVRTATKPVNTSFSTASSHSQGVVRAKPVFESEIVRHAAKVVPGVASRRAFLKLHAHPLMAGSTRGAASSMAKMYQLAGENPAMAVATGAVAGRTPTRRWLAPGHRSLLQGGALGGATTALTAGLNYLVGDQPVSAERALSPMANQAYAAGRIGEQAMAATGALPANLVRE